MKVALLNKLRNKIEGLLREIALYISKSGLTPNALTLISLPIAVLGFFLALLFKSGLLLAVAIAVSGFVDAVDGAVARLTGMSSRWGAFLDSFIDRVCEAVYALCFIELGFSAHIVLLFLVFSYLISYVRARGESLGMQLAGVGLMERAERVIALVVVALLVDISRSVAQYLYTALTVLAGITVVQRFVYAQRYFKSYVSAERS